MGTDPPSQIESFAAITEPRLDRAEADIHPVGVPKFPLNHVEPESPAPPSPPTDQNRSSTDSGRVSDLALPCISDQVFEDTRPRRLLTLSLADRERKRSASIMRRSPLPVPIHIPRLVPYRWISSWPNTDPGPRLIP